MAHSARDAHRPEHPAHVTLRAVAGVASLRGRAAWVAIVRALRAIRGRHAFRVVHYSVMTNHLHMVIEADDPLALSRAMRALCTSLAKRLNRALGRTGAIFADRYHARVLTSPRSVRHALHYVLLNARKHAAEHGELLPASWIDPRSSAATFDGWLAPPPCREADADFGTASARTWLLRVGWRRHGLLALDEIPGASARSRTASAAPRSTAGRSAAPRNTAPLRTKSAESSGEAQRETRVRRAA